MIPDTLVFSNIRYVPDVGERPVRYFVKRDWERDDYKGVITRPGMPMVFRMGELEDPRNGHYTRLTEEWQFFWFDLCSNIVYMRYHEELNRDEFLYLAKRVTALGSDDRAFTNEHGMNSFRNYLTGENPTAELPAIYTLVCGGASINGEVIGDMLKVDHFDGTQSPPNVHEIDPFTDPRVFFAVTVHAGPRVFHFPQLGGLDVPVPIIASRDIYYPLKDLVRYEDAYKRVPYYPE